MFDDQSSKLQTYLFALSSNSKNLIYNGNFLYFISEEIKLYEMVRKILHFYIKFYIEIEIFIKWYIIVMTSFLSRHINNTNIYFARTLISHPFSYYMESSSIGRSLVEHKRVAAVVT